MKKIIFLLFLLPSVSFAAGWTGNISITGVTQSSDGKLYVKQSATTFNPDNCTYNDTYVMYKGHVGINRSLAMLLYAHQNNLKVRFYLNGCNGGSVPVFSNVQLVL